MSKHTMNLGTYSIRNQFSGEIDVQATVDKFAAELSAQVCHETNDLDLISHAVENLFDRYPGVNISTDSVIHQVLRDLNVEVLNDKAMTQRIRSYIQDNTGDTREAGKLFKSTKGMGGGVCRWSEYVEKPAKTSKKNA